MKGTLPEDAMLITKSEKLREKSFACVVCGKKVSGIGSSVGVCPECLRTQWEASRWVIDDVHAGSRKVFGLPVTPPQATDGLSCKLCFHRCRMTEGETGYCGVRTGSRNSLRRDGRMRAKVSYYFDPLPTNCVADWVCAGGTGAGYPAYANDKGPEVGFYNLAVFFEACNLNCLYCQNWHFKKTGCSEPAWLPLESLAGQVTGETSCICYFGGDPVPQLPYALRLSEQTRREHPDRVLRICWETNGTMHPAWLKSMVKTSLESGGCVKVDLKAWDPRIHRALCGFDNRHILENFARLAQWVPLRPNPPLLVASTLLVPGYVGAEEVFGIASFIAGLNPDIPYALLAFAPQFCLTDFPPTALRHAQACLEAAKRAGLKRVRLGNRDLLY